MTQTNSLTTGILYTDFYQLTMAQAYFRMGLHERQARFEHFFRRYPNYGAHQAGYCINAGLQPLVEWMQQVRFGETEIEVLRAQRSSQGLPLFGEDFLAWLAAHGDFSQLTLDAIPEGRVVHPHVPLTVVTGPLVMAQILETALLNFLNFATLIATKAARVRESAGNALLMEFGLRRAQGWGGNSATRSALIGGANFSSNTGTSIALGLPPKGTHAHAFIQSALAMGMSELDAFRAYADCYPDDTLLLVDTIDTLNSGVPNAITVFQELQAKGHRPVGIRLDSGDLAYLAIQSAKLLDDAGFPEVAIVLSNNLDELVIWQITAQIRTEARRFGTDPDSVLRRLVYGVGTKLVTSKDDAALGGVYKLVALQDHANKWQPAIKVSESAQKTPTPGVKNIYRLYNQADFAEADLLLLAEETPELCPPPPTWPPPPAPPPILGEGSGEITLHHPIDRRRRTLSRESLTFEPLLERIIEQGEIVTTFPTLDEIRARRRTDLASLDPGVRRLINPHIYHVSLTPALWELKRRLIREARN